MRTFIIIWLGQLVSTVGSYMTEFAITIWAWELTGQATALALVGFFTQVPRVLMSLFAGVIVDRTSRKFLMMTGDTVAVLSTIAILLLSLTGNLQIWHLYVTGSVNGAFGQIQDLAYSVSISTMVPKQQYARASGMNSALHYGSAIIAPALAGTLYYVIGLIGILLIDITTFAIALLTLLFVHIPQPSLNVCASGTESSTGQQRRANIWREFGFGFRYIFARPSLLAILVFTSLFWFAHDFGRALYSPMILARTDNDARVLASLSSAAGIGGVIAALLVSTWGGPKSRIHGVLLGFIGAGLSKTVFGLGQMPLIWIPAQFCSSLNFPLLGSSEQAIWLLKVKADVQGRVFAARSMITLVASPISYLIAGPLADYVLEPAMLPSGSLARIFGWIFGTGPGAGMALLYVISSICLLLIGLSGYAFRTLRDVEIIVPDDD